MKPPENMPLPWVIQHFPHKGGENAFIFDKDGMSFQEAYGGDQEHAALYIQHCVNNYPMLVCALEKIRSDATVEPSYEGITAFEALAKAGEL